MNSEEIRSEGHRALLVVVCDVEENYSVSRVSYILLFVCVDHMEVCLCLSYVCVCVCDYKTTGLEHCTDIAV